MNDNHNNFHGLSITRKIQKIYFILLRIKFLFLQKPRLKKGGEKNLIQRLLFWTPEFISMGNHCLIWSGCRLEGITQWKAQIFSPNLVLGNNVSIQQNCHITFASTLKIGNNVDILCGATITDIDHIQRQSLVTLETCIGDNCLIGAGAVILAGTNLGTNCIVGANAVVRGIYPAGSMIAGVPGRIIKRYDQESNKWQPTRASSQR